MDYALGGWAEHGLDNYTVFPNKDDDTFTTGEFDESTATSNNDLSPWTDVYGRPMLRAVDTSPGEFAPLESYVGVGRLPKPQTPTDRNRLRQDHDDPVRREYAIYPVDGRDLAQRSPTGASPPSVLLKGGVEELLIWDRMAQRWVAFLTAAQAEQVEAMDSVRLVLPIHDGRRCRVAARAWKTR